MGTFASTKIFPIRLPDLTPVVHDVTEHFKGQGFDVTSQRTITSGYHISISKGALFKSVLGMRTALNIEIEPTTQGTTVKAGVGIFGQQFIPTLITTFIAWPILFTQLAGMVQQSQLDEDALLVTERSLIKHSGPGVLSASAVDDHSSDPVRFCTSCGQRITGPVTYCIECGAKVA